MDSLRRLFGDTWPYRRRIVGVICCAVAIGGLYAAGFAAVLPLMKVMISREGLHGSLVCRDKSLFFSFNKASCLCDVVHSIPDINNRGLHNRLHFISIIKTTRRFANSPTRRSRPTAKWRAIDAPGSMNIIVG